MDELYIMRNYNRHILLSFLLFLLGAIVVFTATARYGPGANTDSFYYAEGAKALARDFNLMTYDTGWGAWPPLDPICLSLFIRLGFNVEVASAILNALLLGGTLLILFRMLERRYKATTAFLASFICLLSYPILYIYVKTLSEPLFIFLSVAFLFQAERIKPGYAFRDIIWLGVLASLAVLTRYAGAAMIITGAILILTTKNQGARLRLSALILFLFVSSALLALWLSRNYYLTHTFTSAGRVVTGSHFTDSLLLTLDTLSYWLMPKLIPPGIRISLFVILILGAALWYGKHGAVYKSQSAQMLFFTVYTGFIIFCATIEACNMPEDRLLSPLFIPMAIILLPMVLSSLSYIRKQGWRKLVVLPTLLVIAFSMCFGLFYYSVRVREGGGGFNSAIWRESDAIRQLQEAPQWVPAKAYFYSNKAEGLAYITWRAVSRFPDPGLNSYVSFQQKLPPVDSGYVLLFYNLDFAREYYTQNLKQLISDAASFLHLHIPVNPRIPRFQKGFKEQYGAEAKASVDFAQYFREAKQAGSDYQFTSVHRFRDAELFRFRKMRP